MAELPSTPNATPRTSQPSRGAPSYQRCTVPTWRAQVSPVIACPYVRSHSGLRGCGPAPGVFRSADLSASRTSVHWYAGASHLGSSRWHSQLPRDIRALIAVLTWEARPTGLTRAAITGTRTARAASTPWEMAQSRSRDGIICTSESSAVRGTGRGQPVRCARTDSSAHSLTGGYSSRAGGGPPPFRPGRGRAEETGPQVMGRGPAPTPPGGAAG